MNHNNLSYHGISSSRVCVVHSGGVVFHVQCININDCVCDTTKYALRISQLVPII